MFSLLLSYILSHCAYSRTVLSHVVTYSPFDSEVCVATRTRLLRLPSRPPRQAYDPRLELDLGWGVGQVHLVHAWLGTNALKCKAPSILSRAAEERDGWMGGKRSSGGKDI